MKRHRVSIFDEIEDHLIKDQNLLNSIRLVSYLNNVVPNIDDVVFTSNKDIIDYITNQLQNLFNHFNLDYEFSNNFYGGDNVYRIEEYKDYTKMSCHLVHKQDDYSDRKIFLSICEDSIYSYVSNIVDLISEKYNITVTVDDSFSYDELLIIYVQKTDKS